jgi:acyl carrier protein
MPVVKVEPSTDHPIPYSTDEEKPATFMDEVSITAMTAELLEQLGAPLEVDNVDLEREKKLIKTAIDNKKATALRTPMAATAVRGFLQEYGRSLGADAAQVRTAITNKLLEIADCGDTKYELKALELLGKHSDIGLFTERTEININYNSPEALESAIKERVKRLLNADIIDVTPLGMDLDEELGIAIMDGEFSEIEENQEDSGDTSDEVGE